MEKDKIKEIEDVLDKLFGDEKVKYFQSSDAYKRIAGDTFVSYRFDGHKGAVVISVGGSNIDETPIKVCYSGEEIKTLLNAIFF